MPHITINDLRQIKEKQRAIITLRDGTARITVVVHMGACGIAAGARTILQKFLKEIKERETKDVIVTIADCAGNCNREPMITVQVNGAPPVIYGNLTEEKAREIFVQHILGGAVLDRYRVEERTEP